MTKIKNREKLSDFLDILDEFIEIDDCQFSFEELSMAANTFWGQKGSCKHKGVHLGWIAIHTDRHYEMIIQPKTYRRLSQDFGMIEDCIYARSAQYENFKDHKELNMGQIITKHPMRSKSISSGDFADGSHASVWCSKLNAELTRLRKSGFVVQKKRVPMAKILRRANQFCEVKAPSNLPVREILVTEYWLSNV